MSAFDTFINEELDSEVIDFSDEEVIQTLKISEGIEMMDGVPLEVLFADLTPVELWMLRNLPPELNPIECIVRVIHLINALRDGDTPECVV